MVKRASKVTTVVPATKSAKPVAAPVATPEALKPVLPEVTLAAGQTWEQAAADAKLMLKAISKRARQERKGASKAAAAGEYGDVIHKHLVAMRDEILALPSAQGKVIRALSVRISPETGEPEIKSLRVATPRG